MAGDNAKDADPRTIDILEILDLLPHRYPFVMVDRILEIETGVRAVGLKNVTINEPFFQGHFPKRPVMPGVLMVEAMAQAAGIVVVHSLDAKAGRLVYFMSVESAHFRRPVVPGDQLLIKVEKLRSRGLVWKFKGSCEVDGAVAADAVFTAMIAE